MRQVKDIPPTPTEDGALFGSTPVVAPAAKGLTESDLDAEFAKFWEHYPRHTGKKAARAAYARARRSADVRAIAQGLLRQLPSLRDTDPKYVPHPTTWLNQGRWEDEVQPAAVGQDVGYIPPARTDPFTGRY